MRRPTIALAMTGLLLVQGCRSAEPTPTDSAYLGSAGRALIQVVFFQGLREGALNGRVKIYTGGLASVGPFTGTREGDQVALSATRIKQAGTWQGRLAGDALLLALPKIDSDAGSEMFGGGSVVLIKTKMLQFNEFAEMGSDLAETPSP